MGKKVYVLFYEVDYEGDIVIGIFDDKERARNAMHWANQDENYEENSGFSVLEYELNQYYEKEWDYDTSKEVYSIDNRPPEEEDEEDIFYY